MIKKRDKKVIIIGGGPAGLTAALSLSQRGVESIVLEKDVAVGGLSRTVHYNGYHFDIGGHRFYTKVKAVEDLWHEVLGEDLLKRKRLSRIYYDGKYFRYPLQPLNALLGLGIWNSILILTSYLQAQLHTDKPENNFEQWVTNRFGKRLYYLFFKHYTEKVWGIPCHEISAEWAAQRIKGLSLLSAVKDSLIKNNNNKPNGIKTLIEEFYYPRKGPGMMWENVADTINQNGGRVQMESEVLNIFWSEQKVVALETAFGGQKMVIQGTDFISSMPIRELIQRFEPRVPAEVLTAAERLNYRDFLTVALIVNKREVFPDNWIYIHDPGVKIGRVQNYKNWSPDMVPDTDKTCIGLEYFCCEGDELWEMSDENLINFGKHEVIKLGFIDESDFESGAVVRMPKAYPVYDPGYKEALRTVRDFVGGIENLQLVGRNGMHRYNNQDHSMLTAMLASENILGAHHDVWDVNTDLEYHEEISNPEKVSDADRAVIKVFARIDKLGFAAGSGLVSGLFVFLSTVLLTIADAGVTTQAFQLLSQYFIGYSVTFKGSFIGMGYTFVWGFLFGWLFAYLHNIFIAFYIYRVKRKLELLSFRDFLDHF